MLAPNGTVSTLTAKVSIADKADIAVRVVNDCFSNTEPAMKSTIGGNQTSAAVEYFALLQRRWVYFELSRERL
jgi:hypothetical protein